MTTAEKIKEGCGKLARQGAFKAECGIELLCPICQAKLSQYKSDLQQELEKWEELDKDNAISLNKDYMFKVKDRINFIKKELEEIGE